MFISNLFRFSFHSEIQQQHQKLEIQFFKPRYHALPKSIINFIKGYYISIYTQFKKFIFLFEFLRGLLLSFLKNFVF